MIASLHGVVQDIRGSHVVISAAGVGYLVACTPSVLASITRGQEALVHTTMIVREDAMLLYGFADIHERDMFAVLLKAKRFGAASAFNLLSALSPTEIATAIANGDEKALTKANGVGKRIASQLILDLKEEVRPFLAGTTAAAETVASNQPQHSGNVDENQVLGALMGLGFKEAEASEALAQVLATEPDLTTSLALKATLKVLGANQ